MKIVFALLFLSFMFCADPSRLRGGFEVSYIRPYQATNSLLITASVVTVTSCNVYVGATITPSAIEGTVWYRSDTHKLKCYDGTLWQDLF